jgi:hypothetical protein
MSLYITPYAKCFAAALMRALKGLLAGAAVTVDIKAARLRKCFVACLADVAVL